MSTLATFSLKNSDAHVSHKIGNSLCSHPALLISAFGGICGGGLSLRIRKLRKASVGERVHKKLSIAFVSMHHVRHLVRDLSLSA